MEELKVILTLDEINMVLSLLSEKPYKMVNNTITKITAQAESQLKARALKVQEEEEEVTSNEPLKA